MRKIFQSIIAAIILVTSINFAIAAENLHIGEGIYQFAEPTGANDKPMNIHYYRPKNWQVGDKIFVAFHGIDRHPQYVIKGLQKTAEKKNFLLICPEFDKEKFPGDRYYSLGNVMSKGSNGLMPKTQWTYNAANRIIDDVKNRTGSANSKVIFFGHSAGGQFMHRYLFFADKIKADRVIASNAGMYVMPDEDINFPYGLKNTPITAEDLKRAYNQDVIILLGEKDVLRGKHFPDSAQAEAQGSTRFDRGKNFYIKSNLKAQELGTRFNWRLITVPNIGHAGVSMAKQAVKYID